MGRRSRTSSASRPRTPRGCAPTRPPVHPSRSERRRRYGHPVRNAFGLVRYTADGTLDESFGTGGKVRTTLPRGAEGAFEAITIDDLGRPVAAGSAVTALSVFKLAVARYRRDGELDRYFDGDGKIITDFGPPGVGDAAESLAIDDRGRIVTAGGVGEFELARFIGEAPATLKISGPAEVRTRQHRARAKFSFVSNEPVQFRCRVDRRTFDRCSSPYRTPELRVGDHTLKVQATDRARNHTTKTKPFEIVRRR